jgi:hypothetical protein
VLCCVVLCCVVSRDHVATAYPTHQQGGSVNSLSTAITKAAAADLVSYVDEQTEVSMSLTLSDALMSSP